MSLQVDGLTLIDKDIGENYEKPPRLLGIDYDQKDVWQARDKGQLLRINIEVGQNKCNLRCVYCYSGNGKSTHKELLSEKDICDIIIQAKDLGARSVILTGGGEPLLNKKRFFNLAKFVKAHELIPVVFTNGTCIDRETARQLDLYEITVVTKLNSLNDPGITNRLSGQTRAHMKMWRGVSQLLKTGLAERCQLGLESVITKENYAEIIKLWRWVRMHRIIPYFELTKLQGRAKRFAEILEISPQKAHKLFEALLKIDRDEYGYTWDTIPPIPGSHCNRLYCGCYINTDGHVQPCAGIPIYQGNVKREKLLDIIHKESFMTFRHIEKHLKGHCGTCDLKGFCYGCRGNAYQATGDPYAGDPACWRTYNHNV